MLPRHGREIRYAWRSFLVYQPDPGICECASRRPGILKAIEGEIAVRTRFGVIVKLADALGVDIQREFSVLGDQDHLIGRPLPLVYSAGCAHLRDILDSPSIFVEHDIPGWQTRKAQHL